MRYHQESNSGVLSTGKTEPGAVGLEGGHKDAQRAGAPLLWGASEERMEIFTLRKRKLQGDLIAAFWYLKGLIKEIETNFLAGSKGRSTLQWIVKHWHTLSRTWQMLHPWEHSRWDWVGFWATWYSWRCPCLLQESWITRPFKSHYQSKQCYDSVIFLFNATCLHTNRLKCSCADLIGHETVTFVFSPLFFHNSTTFGFFSFAYFVNTAAFKVLHNQATPMQKATSRLKYWRYFKKNSLS